MKCLFFLKEPTESTQAEDLPGSGQLTVEVWRPGLLRAKPRGVAWLPFAVWWLFHVLRVFRNRHYSLLLLRRGDRVVHRSCVFPGYFRFSFMGLNDLQVGDTWTAQEERGKGLAALALRWIVSATPGRRLWYLTDESNVASIRVAERCGFRLVAEGARTRRFGLAVLGSYVMTGRPADAGDMRKTQ